jgi:arylsulfatase A-like enzyme
MALLRSFLPSFHVYNGVCFILLLVLSLGCERACTRTPPDVILITVDTLRPDHLGAYGYKAAKTPHIDALAKRGTTFVNAFAPMGRTTPSLVSMLTGLWPHEQGCREVRTPIKRGTLITTVLKKAGYTNLGVTANRAAARKEGLAAGFDAFVQVADEPEEDWDAADVTAQALALVNDAPREKPVFLWVHYLDPHWPYQPPGATDRATKECSTLERIGRGAWESNADGRSHELLSKCRKAYDEEVAFTDTQIGRLLAELRKSKRLDNAVILFTADHGENFGEAGLYYAHGPNVHDANLRIPMIVAGLDVEQGATRHEVIRLVDMAPTILSLAKIPESEWPSMQGVDYSQIARDRSATLPEEVLAFAESGGTLVRGNHSYLLSGRPTKGYCINKQEHSLCWKRTETPALYDRKTDPKMRKDLRSEKPELYGEMFRARERWRPGMTRERSASDGRFKLIERPLFAGGYARTLHDTQTDPGELVDVRDAHPDVYHKLSQALADWTADVPGYVQEALSDEAEAQLKALGYVD